MTCIVGIGDGERVWIGADSAGVADHDMAVRRDPKVFSNKHVLIGFTSSFRMGQALMFGWEPPALNADADPFAWMCTGFVDSVRARLGDAGFRRKENEVESGGAFLVGVAGRLFMVDTDFQVEERLGCYNACGSGAPYALGALHFITKGNVDPSLALEAALHAASRHCSSVRKPFFIQSIGGGA